MRSSIAKGAKGGMLVLVLFFGLCRVPGAHAQEAASSLIDGLTFGVGLNIYQGDVDSNPTNNPVKYLGAGNLNLLVGVDRRFGDFGAGLDVTYDRFSGENETVAFANNAFSLALVGSYGLSLIRPDLLRLFAGAGPTLLLPRYYRFQPPRANDERYRNLGTRFVLNFPVGIIIQDRIRIGIRMTSSDYLDGFEGTRSGSLDFLTYVNLGYRLNF